MKQLFFNNRAAIEQTMSKELGRAVQLCIGQGQAHEFKSHPGKSVGNQACGACLPNPRFKFASMTSITEFSIMPFDGPNKISYPNQGIIQ